MKEQNSSLTPGLMQTDRENPSSKPSRQTTSQDRFWVIYSTLRERIALLIYPPGVKLSESDLATEFGVSRTPLRSALNRLEAEGLVESRHGVGTFVTILDMDELREVYQLRRELAGLLGQFSSGKIDKGLIDRIQEIRRECEQVEQADDPRYMFAKCNIDFFWALMELVENRALTEAMQRLFYRTARMWPALTSDEEILAEAKVFLREIDETLRTLEAGDIYAMSHVHQAHISLAFKRLADYRERN